ncbi:hypothetical protein CONPUDRAFT_151109 [Coniophora puteana RWD-64-598 SS2]|uniref:Uncharacterized protein n=1 Tax=Coniophora puteana (strain RWD-64-598) TaxID=741705 RepID=A0A5M3MZK8_CONPW|nr:uncharacterized protein CONPUDRAFT_151109 [Coniophora puteana RWD-64-598 SS2]EIW84061.1 hypothetical protein CONPUDRAFT_151109 [Coniophora puteana RWD-64-598 SS2]
MSSKGADRPMYSHEDPAGKNTERKEGQGSKGADDDFQERMNQPPMTEGLSQPGQDSMGADSRLEEAPKDHDEFESSVKRAD